MGKVKKSEAGKEAGSHTPVPSEVRLRQEGAGAAATGVGGPWV